MSPTANRRLPQDSGAVLSTYYVQVLGRRFAHVVLVPDSISPLYR